jgi:hypothetical protein
MGELTLMRVAKFLYRREERSATQQTETSTEMLNPVADDPTLHRGRKRATACAVSDQSAQSDQRAEGFNGLEQLRAALCSPDISNFRRFGRFRRIAQAALPAKSIRACRRSIW